MQRDIYVHTYIHTQRFWTPTPSRTTSSSSQKAKSPKKTGTLPLSRNSTRLATRCNTLQHTATHCNAGYCTTEFHVRSNRLRDCRGRVSQPTHATYCNLLQHIATHCNTLQHSATHCNTLQHIAKQGIILRSFTQRQTVVVTAAGVLVRQGQNSQKSAFVRI